MAAALVAIATLLVTVRAVNIVGDVSLAAAGDGRLQDIVGTMQTAYDELRRTVGKIVVLAHSQGGYLTHTILRRRGRTRRLNEVSRFIGVGSGLKPIFLFTQLRRPRCLAAAWLALGGVAVLAVGAWPLVLRLAS